MTKVEAIQKVLEDHNGIGTWEIIYQNIEKYYPSIKNSKDWEAGIRGVLYRELRNNQHFKKIGLALYALKDYEEVTLEEIQSDPIRMHSHMEGICVEIGNFLNLQTFTADPSAKYNNLCLSEIATMPKIPDFTYPAIIDSAKRIDVLWFNDKGFQYPKRAIEIVDSIGTLEPALKRTLQLLEFNLSFYILSRTEYLNKISKALDSEPYMRVKHRYKVRDYEHILNVYKNPFGHKNDDFLKIDQYF